MILRSWGRRHRFSWGRFRGGCGSRVDGYLRGRKVLETVVMLTNGTVFESFFYKFFPRKVSRSTNDDQNGVFRYFRLVCHVGFSNSGIYKLEVPELD